jgi:PilZ domain
MIDERRKRERLRLRLPVLLLRADSNTPISSETANISNDGFYCETPEPLSPGEKLTCLLALPTQPSISAPGDPFYIEGQVDVVRLVGDNATGFGIGCRICQYRIISREGVPAWAQIRVSTG